MADSTPSPAARRRLTGAQRRALILDAACHEFAQHGFQGASTADIARRAGCSEPMLYKHFASKAVLFAAVLEETSTQVERRFDELIAAPGNLLDTWHEALPGIMRDPRYALMMRFRQLAISMVDHPEVRGALLGMHQRHLERVGRALERGRAEGAVRADVDAEYVAWVWHGIMQAASTREALEAGGFGRMLPHALRFVDGLRPDRS
jgi:AcrR family transcriptional regulator